MTDTLAITMHSVLYFSVINYDLISIINYEFATCQFIFAM